MTKLKMKDGIYWRFYWARWTNVGNPKNKGRNKKESGWIIVDHEGYKRYRSGNWQEFVPFFNLIAETYGFEVRIS